LRCPEAEVFGDARRQKLDEDMCRVGLVFGSVRGRRKAMRCGEVCVFGQIGHPPAPIFQKVMV
jgi:hypothetical protein